MEIPANNKHRSNERIQERVMVSLAQHIRGKQNESASIFRGSANLLTTGGGGNEPDDNQHHLWYCNTAVLSVCVWICTVAGGIAIFSSRKNQVRKCHQFRAVRVRVSWENPAANQAILRRQPSTAAAAAGRHFSRRRQRSAERRHWQVKSVGFPLFFSMT